MIVERTVGPWRASAGPDQPGAAYEIFDWLSRDLPRQCSRSAFATRRAVVELRRTAGGLIHRALIGGEIRASTGIRLHIGVSATLTRGAARSCPSSLYEPLVPGLPDEFARSVLDTLWEGLARVETCLEMRIDRAGYDEVDSTPLAFSGAANVLLAVLVGDILGRDAAGSIEAALQSWRAS